MRDMVSYAAAGEKRLEKSSGRYDLYASEINELIAQAGTSPAAGRRDASRCDGE